MKQNLRYDLTGQRFGRLAVISYVPSTGWLCQCDCGSETRVCGTNLRRGHTRSCGCLKLETVRRPRKAGGHATKNSITYKAWRAMRHRCLVPTSINYKDYGGRGIQICERWSDFTSFLADMGERPSRKHTIERRDGNGHYEPDNCHWATYTEQANNKRTNRIVEWQGRSQTVAQWAKELGLSSGTIQSRLNKGMAADDAFASGSYRLVEINGQRRKLSEVLAETGISMATYYQRKRNGWPPEKILTTPANPARKRKLTEPHAFPSPAAVSRS